MAELDGMNMTTNMAYAPESGALDAMNETGGSVNLDYTEAIVGIVTSILTTIIAALGVIVAIYECRKIWGHKTGPKLEDVQKRVMEYNKDTTSTIPAHPLDSSRTLDIDQFSELELTETLDRNEMTQKPIRLQEGVRNLHKVRTKPLRSLEDVLRVLDKNLRILLSGGAGFGKSTLLLRVANKSTDPTSLMAKFKLVFLVKLKHMQQTCCILEAIRDQILPNIDKGHLKKIIDDNEKDTAFLFDGLGDVATDVLNTPAPEGGYGVIDILHNKVLRCSTVLVSSRPRMNDVVIQGYPHYTCMETLGFTFETAKKYITSYFARKNATDRGISLISHITSRASLQTLAQIPIMVLFMCIVWENESKLPDKITALYTEFTKALVSRRCNEGEDKEALIESVVNELGPIALHGLLDTKGERLVFTSEEFDDKKALEDGCRLGFLQKESITSGPKKMEVVQFPHKSIQEYFAGCYLAHLYDTDENKFHEELKKVKPKNVLAMKDLLRFACGTASGPEVAGLILEHVQKQCGDEMQLALEQGRHLRCRLTLQNLPRCLLFESGLNEMTEKLNRPTDAEFNSQEDLLAMQYYLQCLPQPLEELGIQYFSVYSKSHEDLVLLRDLYDQVHGKLAENHHLIITCKSHEDLKLLSEILSCIGPTLESCSLTYVMSEQVNKALHTLEELLEGMDEGLRGKLDLELAVNETSHFDDDCELGSLSHVCSRIEDVTLDQRTHYDVIRLGIGMSSAGGLQTSSVYVYDTDLHGHLGDMTPFVSQSLHRVILNSCGLDDDDIPDLIRILPAGHGLWTLRVDGNAFSADGVETLTAHLQHLPKLVVFTFSCLGSDAEHNEKVVKQILPNDAYVTCHSIE